MFIQAIIFGKEEKSDLLKNFPTSRLVKDNMTCILNKYYISLSEFCAYVRENGFSKTRTRYTSEFTTIFDQITRRNTWKTHDSAVYNNNVCGFESGINLKIRSTFQRINAKSKLLIHSFIYIAIWTQPINEYIFTLTRKYP